MTDFLLTKIGNVIENRQIFMLLNSNCGKLANFKDFKHAWGVLSWTQCILAALLHGTPERASAELCGVLQGIELRNFRRGLHLYSARRPSRWASAHILVCF